MCQLTHYDSKRQLFKSQYGVFGEGSSAHYRVESLLVPSGQDFEPLCHLQYTLGIPGETEGETIVHNADGTSIHYRFTKQYLIKDIETYDAQGTLKLHKHFTWTENQWLHSLELRSEGGHLQYTKTYAYDRYGNPLLETLTGDLSGTGEIESASIKREYSQERGHLLLREEYESGKVICYEYLSQTHLPTAIYIQDRDTPLIRELYTYDQHNNLIKKTVDDGPHYTQQTSTRYHLRQEPPFLHMPEWVEEAYLENGEEKLAIKTHLTYDHRGNIVQEKIYDSEGTPAYTLHKTYNERGDLLSETNPLGQEKTYSYDAKGRCIQESSYSKNLHTYKTYNESGHCIHKKQEGTLGLNQRESYRYDLQGHLIEKIDRYDNSTHFTYDPCAHRVIRSDKPLVASSEGTPQSVTTHSTYDPLGRKTSHTDATSNTTHWTYNARGQKTSIHHPDRTRETYTYDKEGQLTTHTDPEGLTLHYTRDIQGRILVKTYKTDRPLAAETYTYDSFHLIAETDKEGHATTYTYDSLGRKEEENRSGRITTYRYDPLGRLSIESRCNAENSLHIHYERDLLGRVTTTTNTDLQGTPLHKISYSYDEDGSTQTITRYIHNKPSEERYTYDELGRCLIRQDPIGHSTTTTYADPLNNLGQKVLQTETTDPQRTRTRTTYDAFGNIVHIEVLDPEGNSLRQHTYTFDPSGNCILEQDSAHTIKYTYTKRHQRKSETRAFDSSSERTTQYTYTPKGTLATKTLPDHTVLSYTYHPLGYQTALDSSDKTIKHRYHRNLLGQLLAATNHHHQITRTLDPFGNILQETLSTGATLSKSYDTFNRPLSLTLPDRSAIHYSYDPLHMKSVSRRAPFDQPLYTHTYTHRDLEGNATQEELIEGSGTLKRQYDPCGRERAQASPYHTHHMTYDMSGNLLSIKENETLRTHTYDKLHQLITETHPQSAKYTYDTRYNRIEKNKDPIEINTLDELCSCGYDMRGNLIRKDQTHYTYDALNQLIEATNTHSRITITYDPLGRRLSKTVKNLQEGERNEWTEHYLWDGPHELGVFTPYGMENLKVLGEKELPVSIELRGKAYTPLLDVQGSVRHLIDPRYNTIASSTHYTAFGQELPSSEAPLPNPWRYASKRWDPELGLSYFDARYFDPELARWLTPDPAGFKDSTNLYQYLLNNPFKYYDPHGENILGFCFGIGQMVLGGVVMVSGVAFEICSFGGYTVGFAVQEAAGFALLTGGYAYALHHTRDMLPSSHNSFNTSFNPAVLGGAVGIIGSRMYKESKNTDIYAPDRPLPRDKRTKEPVPDTDKPHTQLGTRKGSKGKYPQAREFDKDGKPVRDIDFTDHGRPHEHTKPHQHKHIENSTGGTPQRGDPEPVPERSYE